MASKLSEAYKAALPYNYAISDQRRIIRDLLNESTKVLDNYYNFMRQRKINHLILSGLAGVGAGLLGYGASKIYNIARNTGVGRS